MLGCKFSLKLPDATTWKNFSDRIVRLMAIILYDFDQIEFVSPTSNTFIHFFVHAEVIRVPTTPTRFLATEREILGRTRIIANNNHSDPSWDTLSASKSIEKISHDVLNPKWDRMPMSPLLCCSQIWWTLQIASEWS